MQLVGIYLQFRFRIASRENNQLAAEMLEHLIALFVSQRRANRRDHCISALAICQILNSLHRVGILGVDDVNAHFLGPGNLLGRNIGNHDTSAKRFGYLRIDQAHRARTDNDNILHRLNVALMRTGHNRSRRFQETSFCRGNVVVDGNYIFLIHHHIVSKPLLSIIAIRARTLFFVIDAVTRQALTASITNAAEAAHAANLLTDFERIVYFIALGNDRASPFMAARHRESLMVTQTHPLLIVSGTDVVCRHFDDDVRRPYFGERCLVHLSNVSFDDNAKMNFVRKHGKTLLK